MREAIRPITPFEAELVRDMADPCACLGERVAAASGLTRMIKCTGGCGLSALGRNGIFDAIQNWNEMQRKLRGK